MKARFTLYILLSLILSACFCSKKSSKTQTEVETKESIIPSDSIFKIRISFISIGAGIDGSAVLKFQEFLRNFEATHSLKLNYKIVNWGREGETDYCFKLSEINASQQNQFVVEAKDVLKNSNLVRYKEDCVCRIR